MNYIERINALKKERKITTQDLSAMTDIPVGTLSKMLAGYSESPRLSYIVAIATAFNVSLDFLISGVEENNNNYTLSVEEIRYVERARKLSQHGKELVKLVINKEYELVEEENNEEETPVKKAKILRSLPEGFERKTIPLFDLPVSAGPGEFLDGESFDNIRIGVNSVTATATYAVRVNGDSMMPKYKSGDIIIVEETNNVEYGELGIFILDGDGYFKKFAGDRLQSLNPEYGDILLDQFDSVICCGRVLSKVKKR